MWETGARPKEALGLKWHLWLMLGLILPPLALGAFAFLQVDLSDLWFAIILASWAVALLMWIPSMTHAVTARRSKDVTLVALYPLLSALLFATLCAALQEGSILGNFERLI